VTYLGTSGDGFARTRIGQGFTILCHAPALLIPEQDRWRIPLA
jgi:hypothetical protein